MTDEEREKKLKFIENQAKFMRSQGFDSVMIFASIFESESGNTSHWALGEGNWCARFGQVREWVVRTEGESARKEG